MASDKRPLSVQTRVLLPSESRAPRLATRTMRYTTPGSPMWPAWNGDSAVERAYYGTVYVHRAVQYLASTIAGLPFRAGAKLPMSPTGTAPSKDQAPLAKLLGPPPLGPNPITSARQLWAWSVAQFLVTGKICWENELATGASKQVLGLWPIPGQYVAPIPTAGGDQFFAKFRVTSVGAQPIDLPIERLTYCWRPSQRDWRQPESVLEAASLPVSIQILLDRYSWAFLKNNAVPSTLVITPGFEEAEERRGFRDQFSGEFTGPDNAGKTMFLETEPEDDTGLATGVQGRPLVQVERLGQSAQDAQLLELRREMAKDVSIAFGVPRSKLGDASERTFANADAEDATTWKETILPLVLDLADQINLHLAPRLGSEVGWFDLSGVDALKPRPKFAVLDPLAAIDAGVIGPSEWRVEVGLPEELPPDAEKKPAPPPPPQLIAPPAEEPEAEEEKPTLAVVRSADSPGPGLRTSRSGAAGGSVPAGPGGARHGGSIDHHPITSGHVKAGDHHARRTSEWRRVDRKVSAVEGPMASAMRKLFEAQATAVLSRLEGKRGRQMLRAALESSGGAPWTPSHGAKEPGETRAPSLGPTGVDVAAIFDRKHWQEETEAAVEPFHAALGALAVDRIDQAVGQRSARASVQVDPFTAGPGIEGAVDALRTRRSRLAELVTATTYDALVAELAAGVVAGEGIPDLSARVAGIFNLADSVRATRISRTEVIGSFNTAGNAYMEGLGPEFVDGQEWISTRDQRTRESHAELDGAVTGVGEAFGNGLLYPGDPNGPASEIVNCRCTTAVILPARSRRAKNVIPLHEALQRLASV